MLVAEQALACFSLVIALFTAWQLAGMQVRSAGLQSLIGGQLLGLAALIACDAVWILRLFG